MRELLEGVAGEGEGEGETYCWFRMTRMGVTTAAATTAAAAMKKIQILVQFAMLGYCMLLEKRLAVYGEDLIQLLAWP